ncbi:translation initiation factor [Prochlorococcus sp. MIT 1223]|uniref:translation initiation factor n=1 Tax=Prochlorococcus sp. MIT 1223 TaxID=3096217 RepID=UPI002A7546B1|nr:translation initiation factor [Prochlorococcus sp. MIT 1223]
MAKGSWREFDAPLIQKENSSFSNIHNKAEFQIRVSTTRSGKAGKTVTLISDLFIGKKELKSLLKKLKSICGTGGTVKENCLELQGDHAEKAITFLNDQGYRVKRAG